MAKRIRKRKCRNCCELFHPDHRNRKKQRYCSKAACRAASKKASNDKWRHKEENRDYFSGPSQVERVREWRMQNPGYSTTLPKSKKTLQDDIVKTITVMRQLGMDILNNVVEYNECLSNHTRGSHDNKIIKITQPTVNSDLK